MKKALKKQELGEEIEGNCFRESHPEMFCPPSERLPRASSEAYLEASNRESR